MGAMKAMMIESLELGEQTRPAIQNVRGERVSRRQPRPTPRRTGTRRAAVAQAMGEW